MARTVPRAYVDGFSDSLETLSDEMRRRLSEALEQVDYTMPVAYVRERLIAIMQAHVYESRTLAAQVASEFYDGLREYVTGERMGAVAYDDYDPVRVERRVRSAVQPLAKAQDEFRWANDVAHDEEYQQEMTRVAARKLCRDLVDYQGYSIKEAAGGTVFGNGRRDSRRVRFARIPRGTKSYPNGCPFCQMLASRGFVYRSELVAGGLDPDHYHSDCRCMVVPSWGEGSVEGYDPSAYDEGYKQYLEQDHSEHEQHVRETQRNRYDAEGRLKSGDGNRVDEKGALTDEDRALIRSKRTAAGNETRKSARSRMFFNLGVTENEWKAMSEAEQSSLLKATQPARSFANGLRRDANYVLDNEDIRYVVEQAESIGIPEDVLRFNHGTQTGVVDLTRKINVRGDVFPDSRSSENRDTMTVRAVLAHEYYGHYAHIGTAFAEGDWRDEFRASYRAAIDAPNLSEAERASLMIDAWQRGYDAGVELRITPAYRRIVFGYE